MSLGTRPQRQLLRKGLPVGVFVCRISSKALKKKPTHGELWCECVRACVVNVSVCCACVRACVSKGHV